MQHCRVSEESSKCKNKVLRKQAQKLLTGKLYWTEPPFFVKLPLIVQKTHRNCLDDWKPTDFISITEEEYFSVSCQASSRQENRKCYLLHAFVAALWSHNKRIFRLEISRRGQHCTWKHCSHWLSGGILLIIRKTPRKSFGWLKIDRFYYNNYNHGNVSAFKTTWILHALRILHGEPCQCLQDCLDTTRTPRTPLRCRDSEESSKCRNELLRKRAQKPEFPGQKPENSIEGSLSSLSNCH